MDFVEEVYRSKEYQQYAKDKPISAKLMLNYYKREWKRVLKSYIPYRDKFRAYNEGLHQANGKWIASIPEVVIHWLKFKSGTYPDQKDLMKYLKEHKEFWLDSKL